ncbi:DUF2157 domain-containing protein [Nocardia cyriacigeorgica]|uniref:DUF2157 domain-containing protein n=1 Tax=Nocardia cyriacigeorgica TaxID=135487 RepID=A0ABX0CKJ7_9NOCA|nr:DUF2157 domain-containing protein [Nocardia cyriacigeorgica]NEW41794.1 DUF2157 domain-containing protein [Nocardia cyriacigeorgica]NEW56788.1 DUF2157 domain-containing protein [Nocardia cyriacigeorgica]
MVDNNHGASDAAADSGEPSGRAESAPSGDRTEDTGVQRDHAASARRARHEAVALASDDVDPPRRTASRGPAGEDSGPHAASLRPLVESGVLTEQQLDAVLGALAEPPARHSRTRLLAEIAAYAGAGLLLAGIALVLAASWEDLARTGRVAILALISVVLAVIAVAVAGGGSALFGRLRDRPGAAAQVPAVRTRLATVLFALAAAFVAGTVGSAIEDGNTDSAWVYACIAGLIAAVIGYLALPSLIGIFTCAGFSAAAVPGVMTDLVDLHDGWPGLAVLLLGIVWGVLTRLSAFDERWAGYLIAVVLAVFGAQFTGEYDTMAIAYWLTALVAVLCFALYLTERSWVLVLGGAAALAIAAAEAVWDWTDGSVGAAGAVLIIGAVVLGVGGYLLIRAGSQAE